VTSVTASTSTPIGGLYAIATASTGRPGPRHRLTAAPGR
jgi:hypothetical protein